MLVPPASTALPAQLLEAPGQKMTDTVTIEDIQRSLDTALASIAKLEKKNSELIDREKKAKADADEAAEAAERVANDAAAKSGDVEKIKAAAAAEMKKVQAKLDAAEASLSTLLIDNAIATKLQENGVMPHLSKALTAFLKADATVKDGQALIGDLPLADHIQTYLTSDEGKHFVAAPQNSGAGATGSTAKAAPPKDWNLTYYTEMKAKDPVGAQAYAEVNGKNFS